MPQQQPRQQPLEWVAALRRNRRKQRKAERVAKVEMPPIRATLNMSQLITDAMRPRLRKVD